jgi:hypothetical protein
MSLIWNDWIGFSKPLMDFRDDGPMPSPPDNPPDDECFWHSCVPALAPPTNSPYDATIEVVPAEFDSVNEVVPAGFDTTN